MSTIKELVTMPSAGRGSSPTLPGVLQGISSLPERIRMRHRRSPLSERSMSRIRAPTRRDFLREVSARGDTTEATSALENERILDALDRLDDAELSAIVAWLQSLRGKERLADKDLTNGVLLRHAMNIVDGEVGKAREDVCEESFRENLGAVRDGLSRLGWVVGDDAWEMGRWVVLAGVTGERCDEIVKGMMELEKGVQDILSDVVKAVMEDAGIGDADLVEMERERRVRAEKEAERLREQVGALQAECERLRAIVEGKGDGKALLERN